MTTIAELARALADLRTQTMEGRDAIEAHAIAESYRLEELCEEAGIAQNEVLEAAASLVRAEHQILERASDALRHMPAGSKAH